MDFKLYGNGLITLPKLRESNNCFPKITADVLPSWHHVNTHLNTPDQQTAKTFTFIEVLTLANDHLFNVISSTWVLRTVFEDAIRLVLSFSNTSLAFCFVLNK